MVYKNYDTLKIILIKPFISLNIIHAKKKKQQHRNWLVTVYAGSDYSSVFCLEINDNENTQKGATS